MELGAVAKLVGVLLYFGVLLAIGAMASRRMKDVRDFYAGGKQLGFWSVAFSARATGESAWLLLGLTGMGAAVGVHAFWIVIGEVVGVSAAWLLMSRRFKRLTDRYDSITVPDYLESRFRDRGQLLRKVSAVALVIFVTIYVSAQIDATGSAFETFLGMNYYAGALLGFAIVLVYCVSGGFLAVVWSDVFQGILMFAGLVLLPVVGLVAAGSWGAVTSGLMEIDPTLLSWAGPAMGDVGTAAGVPGWRGTGAWDLSAVCGAIGFVLIGVGFMGSPQIFVRFLSLKSEREITRGAAVAIAWTVLADSGAVLTGMIGRHLLTNPGQSVTELLGNGAQNVLPEMVDAYLPIALVGLFIAIVLSAIMSTIDSLLVLASSALVRDFHQKVRHPELPDESLVPLSRKATVALALCGLAVALVVAATTPERSVFWFVIFGWSGISATFCPTIIMSLFWRRFTARGALAAMVSGFLAVPFFAFVAPYLPGVVGHLFWRLSELPPAVAVSFVIGIAVSLADRPGQVRLEEVGPELDDAAR